MEWNRLEFEIGTLIPNGYPLHHPHIHIHYMKEINNVSHYEEIINIINYRLVFKWNYRHPKPLNISNYFNYDNLTHTKFFLFHFLTLSTNYQTTTSFFKRNLNYFDRERRSPIKITHWIGKQFSNVFKWHFTKIFRYFPIVLFNNICVILF